VSLTETCTERRGVQPHVPNDIPLTDLLMRDWYHSVCAWCQRPIIDDFGDPKRFIWREDIYLMQEEP
jgi:hypothetical protein